MIRRPGFGMWPLAFWVAVPLVAAAEPQQEPLPSPDQVMTALRQRTASIESVHAALAVANYDTTAAAGRQGLTAHTASSIIYRHTMQRTLLSSADLLGLDWPVAERSYGFEAQNFEHLDQTYLHIRADGSIISANVRTSPNEKLHHPLWSLGLGTNSFAGLQTLLSQPTAADRWEVLDGHRCVVVVGPKSMLWCSPDLGYAPQRWLVQTPLGDDEGAVRVIDHRWQAYQEQDGWWLPRLFTSTAVDFPEGLQGTRRLILTSAGQISFCCVNSEAATEWLDRDVAPIPGGVILDQLGPGFDQPRAYGLSVDDLAEAARQGPSLFGLDLVAIADAALQPPEVP